MPRDHEAASGFRFNTAIICRVSNSFADQTSYDKPVGVGPLDVATCRLELERLVDVMRSSADLDVVELPSDEQQPDGLLVSDIAVAIGGVALICNPPNFSNRPSRHGEIAVVRQVLRKELGLKIVEVGSETAVVEGGDVLWTGREIFVGLSTRTNMLGAQAVARAFPEYSTNIVKVHPPAVHLKDHINVVHPEVLVVSKSPAAQKTFKEIRDTGVSGYQYIEVDDDQSMNVICANNTLIRLTDEQIGSDAFVYDNRVGGRQVGVRVEEMLKRGARLGSCVLLVSRSTRRTRRYP